MLLHRVVKEYIALHSTLGGSIEIIATLTHAPAYSFGSRHSGQITAKALFKTSALSETQPSVTSAAGSSPWLNRYHRKGNGYSERKPQQ